MRPINPPRRYPPQAGQRAVLRSRRRDPAPSRLAFRLQRLWLTPLVRSVVRIGAPIFVVVLGVGLYFGDEGRRATIWQHFIDAKRAVQTRPEFMVSALKIEGAGEEVDAAIRTMLPVTLPASSFDLDLDAYRNTVLRLDAVADVSMVIRPGGILEADVREREPAILWRTAGGLEMLDPEGHRVATLLERDLRPDLPLVAGKGADRAVPEALRILIASGPLLPRIRGLIRVGERRWDLALEDDQRIMLPADNPIPAIERLLALDAAEDLLARDFTHLDLRNNERPTIRLSSPGLETYRTVAKQY
ncbi:cell division protein FtsQ [Thioclava sp. SK-1]|uniref:cell division protein FtsQ/DivIB n=1 Tax=Thioclava sp. SK-1 TaxID=1889770 RepID=UPI000824741B|nr:cell division protein FtsQ/DivIB [Thioclava sp. SK-1]OCX66046.1 cell division protein FtsQ [Thioclava sp. SK-1]